MDHDAAFALVSLAELPRVGERVLQRVQQRARRAGLAIARVLALPRPVLLDEYGLPAAAVQRLCDARIWHRAHCDAILTYLRAVGAALATPEDSTYPAAWATRANPPPPLTYLYGDPALAARPTLALLNSRVVSEHTVGATVRIARRAASEAFALAVGGMKTTHRIAAATARAAGASRIIVLDRGLFAAFHGRLELDPFGFGPGRTRFDPRTTLVLSPFRPHDHAVARNGRRRDELLAALGDIVVAVSARRGGEVERICLRAIDHGQCVLVWQGENAGLLAAGARPLDEDDLRAGLRRYLPKRR